jgi:glycosyltransferase involved in cell wall biosynthesis
MKPLCVIQGPFATRSGYGDKCRDLIRMMIDLNKYELLLVSTSWGMCPMNSLSSERDKEIIDRILTSNQLPKIPDLYIQVTVPSEFQRLGKVNIGYTAGIETTCSSESWLEGCNRMDYVWVVSEHSKKVFEDTVVQHKLPDGTVQKTVKIEKPIEIVPNCVNPSTFRKLTTQELPKALSGELAKIKEDFCFLFVGHWLKGNIGEDRKNVALTIKIFCETFKNTLSSKKPALILKTSGADFSILDQEEILTKIKQVKATVGPNCPKVYLLHGELSEEEMNGLYNHPKVKAHVSFTKGEGFGRPLLEATMSQKPVIASGWSGQLDFLNTEDSILVAGELKPIEPGAVWDDVLIKESSWFNVDQNHASSALLHVFKNYDKCLQGVSTLAKQNREKFSYESVKKSIAAILERDAPAPQYIEMQLPTLKKVK